MKRIAFVAAGIAVVVAACGGQASDQESVTTNAPATTAPATTAPAPATAEGEVVPVDADPCDLMEIEEVATAAGLSVDEARNESSISCVFDFGEEAGVAIFVNVEDGAGRLSGPASLFDNYMATVADGSAEVIPDLGAAAVYSQDFRGLAIDAGGGRFIALGVSGGYGELAEPRDVLIELAAIALDRL